MTGPMTKRTNAAASGLCGVPPGPSAPHDMSVLMDRKNETLSMYGIGLSDHPDSFSYTGSTGIAPDGWRD